MKEKFAVYGYCNHSYAERTIRISGNMETLEEALTFRELAEKTEVKDIFVVQELFIGTVIESVSKEIELSIGSGDKKELYIDLLRKYEMLDLLKSE